MVALLKQMRKVVSQNSQMEFYCWYFLQFYNIPAGLRRVENHKE